MRRDIAFLLVLVVVGTIAAFVVLARLRAKRETEAAKRHKIDLFSRDE